MPIFLLVISIAFLLMGGLTMPSAKEVVTMTDFVIFIKSTVLLCLGAIGTLLAMAVSYLKEKN